jgi:hypothetical protein
MALDLSSVRAKLAHSAKHAQSVRDECIAWGQRNPYSVLQKMNAESTRCAITVHINELPPLNNWSLTIGDCLYSLRCCLDHLVYAIACHEASPAIPAYEGKLQFPITTCKADFDDAVARRRQLGAISDPVRAEIERYQPYNRPHPHVPPLLSILQELSNWDKHRLLRMATKGMFRGQVGMDFSRADPPVMDGDFQFTPTSSPEIEDGTEIGAITFGRPTANVYFDITVFDFVIAIRHSKRDATTPVGGDLSEFSAFLTLLSEEIRTIIYAVSAKVN